MKPEDIDYNKPVEVPIIWKMEALIGDHAAPTMVEYKADLAVLWHDIVGLQTYPYPDTGWDKFKGEKFYVTIYQQGNHICFGDYKYMLKCWSYFRRNIMPYNKL